jgi:hypothetical protein
LPALATACALLVLFAVGHAEFLNAGLRGVLVGIALLQAPGFILVCAIGITPRASEAPALFFSLSIAALLPALLWVALASGSLDLVPSVLAALLGVIVMVASRRYRPQVAQRATMSHEVRVLMGIALALGALLTGGAWILTETGAVDRWWYLAYIRSYAAADTLQLSEPFFGSDFVHPRFSINAWLLLLATWSRLAAVDPVFLYERVAPLFTVPIALSAARLLAGSIFSAPRTIWLTVIATALLWSGGSLFPILTRSVEDKLLAALVLAPVSIAAISRALTSRSASWTLVAALALAAQCTVHPVVYVLTALTALPYIAVMAAGRSTTPAVALALASIIAVGAAYPLSNGSQAREILADDGATLEATEHPIVRIHRARERMVELEGGGYVVDPHLLAHPISLFALLSLFFLGGCSREERFFLVPATLLPLFICFVPPLTSLAGLMGVPWMIYRVLWAVPYGLLAAAGIEAVTTPFKVPAIAVVVLLALGVAPLTQRMLVERLSPARLAHAVPEGEFTEVIAALSTLGHDAVVATAPELAERLPALAGVGVLAMSDRASVVFSGSRAAAEPRLRANALIAAGLWRADNDAPTPTHILIASGASTEKYCGTRLHDGEHYALCTFEAAKSKPGVSLASTKDAADPEKTVTRSYTELLGGAGETVFMNCTPTAAQRAGKLVWQRPGPWSASYPGLYCRMMVGRDKPVGRVVMQQIAFTPFVGAAVDEYIVEVRAFDDLGQRWSVRNRTAVSDNTQMAFRLPRAHAHTFEVTIVPTHLPFVKLDAFDVTFEKGMITSLGGIALD